MKQISYYRSHIKGSGGRWDKGEGIGGRRSTAAAKLVEKVAARTTERRRRGRDGWDNVDTRKRGGGGRWETRQTQGRKEDVPGTSGFS
jgi:hypothetical protein